MDAWDAIWAEVDRLLGGGSEDVPALTAHVRAAQEAHVVDRELRPEATARWLVALADACRRLTETHPDDDADTEIATMRMIATRWLRPARMGPLPARD
jgi:truncated hemoglobin YjbI